MKLIQINSVVTSGSTGRIIEELGQMAIEHGWESYIAYGRGIGSSKSKLIKIGNDFDVNFHGLQTRLFDRHGLGSKKATVKFIEQIEKIKPDIIHLHNLHGYYLNIEVLFKYFAKINIPIVWTFHDCWPFTGHCAHFDFIGCEKWKTECNICPQKKEYPSSIGKDRSKKNYFLKKELFTSLEKLTIVPVSKWLANLVNQSFLSKYPIQVIYNGIDMKVFQAKQNSLFLDKYNVKNKFIILGVANQWGSRKGLIDFIQLSNILDSNYQIILIGLHRKQIQKIPSNIIGISKTKNIHELVSFYSNADVYINPSKEESFGMTTIEAFSCGTPAIVYDVTAFSELITSGTGIVVNKEDIKGLISAVKVIESKGKSSFSSSCRERVKLLFNKDERWLEYLHLYEKKIGIR